RRSDKTVRTVMLPSSSSSSPVSAAADPIVRSKFGVCVGAAPDHNRHGAGVGVDTLLAPVLVNLTGEKLRALLAAPIIVELLCHAAYASSSGNVASGSDASAVSQSTQRCRKAGSASCSMAPLGRPTEA